ncbi:MAG TPA: indolepyruvate ferredoxin oxidoreductase family protein, partial [Stellaceae bacterium]|nr:indolepyruvate ferredoxin oxidoreductase family protein [Stellaceae bacterium]
MDPLKTVTLDDKYTATRGTIYLSGVQALVRLPLMQRALDAAAGRHTAGFISGYRGSPLAGFDQHLWRASPWLERAGIKFVPGLNEDLAATAVWGSQQVGLSGDATVDGVFAMWYGKGPGVDRTGDVFKHANAAGSSALGGVLALAGDDHAAKSSTLPHQSDFAFIDASMPVLHPAGIEDILDLGLHGFALSRYCGAWVGFKAITEAMDSSATVELDPDRVTIKLPEDFTLPPGGLNIRWPDPPPEQERRLQEWKLRAAQAYVRANGLDRLVIAPPHPRFGIVAVGKAYLDVRAALVRLGLDEEACARLGLTLYKVALAWPLETEGARRFARGLEEILVVEEKRALVEPQLRDTLYHEPASSRPRIIGKSDERGAPLLPVAGEVSPAMIAAVIALRLGLPPVATLPPPAPASLERVAYFCSGCPHNSSTKLPAGSQAIAGIGCHYLATNMDRETITYTQMGGEGVPWIGRAPFTRTPHIFANLGDGTYTHSGLLAIRAALAAGVNITYKILFNDAVAMTGGQPIEGGPTPAQITREVAALGVKRITLVTDDPGKYARVRDLAPGTEIFERHALERVQRALRETPG